MSPRDVYLEGNAMWPRAGGVTGRRPGPGGGGGGQ